MQLEEQLVHKEKLQEFPAINAISIDYWLPKQLYES